MTNNNPYGKQDLTPNRSHLTEFDLLVEQQDQEAIHGEISPFTRMQLQAQAEGRPIPRVDLNSPEMQAATAKVFASVRRYRQSSTNPSAALEDDLWSGDGYDLE